MLKTLKKYLKNKILQLLFNKYFRGYKYPFINADMKLAKKTEIQRRNYYRNVYETLYDDFGQMKGYMKDELEEMIRHFYTQAALKTSDIEELTAYRITLIFIKKFEERLSYLASKHKEQKYEYDKVQKVS